MHEKIHPINPAIKVSNICSVNTSINKTQIASIIGVHRSTIYRVLKRNIPSRGRTADQYFAGHAQEKTNRRHAEKRKRIILTKELKVRIAGLMKYEKWSPELISKRLAADGECKISHETIYK